MPPPANAPGSFASPPPTDHECPLCYEDFSETHLPVPLDNCRHVFCQNCLNEWVNSNNAQHDKCPTCRANLFNEPEQQARVPNPRPAATSIQPTHQNEAAFFTQHELATINEITHDLWARFKYSLTEPSSFYRRLNRRVRRTLVPLYNEHELLTPALDTVVRIMLVDLFPQLPAYDEEVDIYAWHLERSLQVQGIGGRAAAYHRLVTRRLVQLVGVMVMLGSVMRVDVRVAKECFKFLGNDLDASLTFTHVNAAAERPSMRNASLLAVFTSLLVENEVEVVRNGMGAQWYVGAQPSDAFLTRALQVKAKLGEMTGEEKYELYKMTAEHENVLGLWHDEEDIERTTWVQIQGFGGLLRNIFRGGVQYGGSAISLRQLSNSNAGAGTVSEGVMFE
jgi:hypothetical protein